MNFMKSKQNYKKINKLTENKLHRIIVEKKYIQ